MPGLEPITAVGHHPGDVGLHVGRRLVGLDVGDAHGAQLRRAIPDEVAVGLAHVEEAALEIDEPEAIVLDGLRATSAVVRLGHSPTPDTKRCMPGALPDAWCSAADAGSS